MIFLEKCQFEVVTDTVLVQQSIEWKYKKNKRFDKRDNFFL